MNTSGRLVSPAERDALEARFGLKACARLNAGLAVPHDVSERLRVARQLAVERAAAKRAPARAGQPALPAPVMHADGTAAMRLPGEHSPWWLRLSSLAPLLLLVLGLVLIQEWSRNEQIAAAADIDAALLADSLPPEAYTDPGFNEFLLADAQAPQTTAAQ